MSPRSRGGDPDVGDLEPTEAESRRSARERALELLYEADPLAVELATGAAEHAERIDPVLARLVAPRWSLARLAAVDRAVLRMGAYELFEAPDRSQALVINEAVVLARRFGTDDSPRFVNGVLSAVAAEARPAAGGAAPEASGDVDDA
jgi:N utilization substance protein B